MKRQLTLYSCVFIIFAALFVARYQVVGQAVYGDGIYYWAYTRSLVIDHDLQFQNEGAHKYGPLTNNRITAEPVGTEKTDLKNDKYYPFGPSLLWLPFFALIHFKIILANNLGFQFANNGYADLYQITVGLVNIAFVIIGITFLHKLLLKYYSPFIASITSLVTLFGTNLLYYGSLDVINTHPASFMLCGIFTFLFVFFRKKMSPRHWLGMGLLLGFMTVVRLQDSLFLLMPLVFFTKRLFGEHRKIGQENIRNLSAFFLGSFLGFLPQLLVSKILYGTFFLLPYTLGGASISVGENKIVQLFVDQQKGLLVNTPLFIAGLIGLWLLKDKAATIKLPFFAVIIAVFILIGSWSGWSQGEAYGMRMFISLLPLIAVGIAEVIRRMLLQFSKTAVIAICLLFIAQNIAMIAAFHLFFHNPTYIGSELSRSGKMKMELLQKIRSL